MGDRNGRAEPGGTVMADSPDEVLLSFAQSTYDAASLLAGWDREMFEERRLNPPVLS